MRHVLVASLLAASCSRAQDHEDQGVASAASGGAADGGSNAGDWEPADDEGEDEDTDDVPNGDDSGGMPDDDDNGGNAPSFDVGAGDADGDEDETRCDDLDFQITLHREVTMNQNLLGEPAGGVGQAGNWSRWFKAMEAIETAVYAHHAEARFGVELHPGATDGCVSFSLSVGGFGPTGSGSLGCRCSRTRRRRHSSTTWRAPAAARRISLRAASKARRASTRRSSPAACRSS